MKKIIVLIPLLLIITACSNSPAAIQKDFSAEVTSEYNGIKIKAEIEAESHNILTIDFISPKSLKGYSYKYKSNEVKVEYEGLMLDADGDYLPENSFSNVIKNVLQVVNNDKVNYSGKYNSKAKYKGKCKSGDFTVTSDFNTGYISRIEIKSISFSADFKIK